MTPALKTLKDPPLLSNPPERQWREVSERDIRLMKEANERNAADPDRRGRLAESYGYMKLLGVGSEVPQEHGAFIDQEIVKARGIGDLWMLARLHFHSRLLGLEKEIPKADRDSLLSNFAAGNPWRGEYYHYLEGTGLWKMPDATRETMKGIDENSAGEFGVQIPWMKSHLIELGLEVDVTDEDRRWLQQTIEAARRDKDGSELAKNLYVASRLFPTQLGLPEPEKRMPPLKKIGGQR